jgi:hypothetical protein
MEVIFMMKRPCEHQIFFPDEFAGRHNDGMCGATGIRFCVTCNRFLCSEHHTDGTHNAHLIKTLNMDGEIL